MHQHDLAQLGFDDEFAAAFAQHEGDGLVPGRVSAQYRGGYRLLTTEGELPGDLAGRYRHDVGWQVGRLPAVGDWVAVRVEGGRAVVVDVLPRRTQFTRKTAWSETAPQVVAANVDTVFLVGALDRNFRAGFLRRLERYLALGWESGAQPVVVLTKTDLVDDAYGFVLEVEAIAYGVPVHALSGVTGEGVEELAPYLLPGRTVALLGSSGVGKSTLVNRLAGREVLAVQETRRDGIGRHTTTHRELVVLPTGAILLDTPGMRELQLWDAGEGMTQTFSDVEELAAQCRFNDCAHEREPGCAIRAAIGGGTLAADRFESYRKLQRELRALEIRQNARLKSEVRKERRRFARSMQRDKY